MTTFLYRVGGSTRTVRTNLAPDPKPVGTDRWFSPAGDPLTVVEEDGEPALEVLNNSGDNAVYTYPPQPVTTGSSLTGPTYVPSADVVAGAWLALGVDVRGLDTAVAGAMRIVFTAAGGGTFAGGLTTVVQSLPVGAVDFTRIVGAVQLETVTASSYFRALVWPVNASAAAGSGFRLRRAVLLIGPTQGEARFGVGTYFDGDTPAAPPLTHVWASDTNNSSSLELEPAYTISPTLVIDYSHQRGTGVVAHDTILGGSPVIVRLASPRTQRGNLLMFCDTQDRALELAELCDGSTNVELASDDVPGAPYTFCPLEDVRVEWNTPYDSWTVTVPYVRTTL